MTAASSASAVSRLGSAIHYGKYQLLLGACELYWAIGGRRAENCLAAYKAARALSLPALGERWIDRGLDAGSQDWRLLRLKGDCHRERAEWKLAQRFYERAITSAPGQGAPRASLARALTHQGNFSEAAVQLRRALEVTAKAPWLINLANCEMRLGRLEEARSVLWRAHRINPSPKIDAMLADLERRLSSTAEDSGEATSGFYDDVYQAPGGYREPWRASVYADVWIEICDLLKSNASKSILDLGCGPGQFAGCVAEMLPAVRYHGVDFSAVAVARGKELYPALGFSELTLPVNDYGQFEPFDAVVCTEVLEHVALDIEVLSPIEAGKFVVFSVPNFTSFGHLRIFTSADEVKARYGALFDRLEVREEAHGAGNILWVASGFRI